MRNPPTCSALLGNPAKAIRVNLWLRVENNSKFVRGKKRVRSDIENYILRRYDMRKPNKNGWEYELTIPYKDDKDLDNTVYDMLAEMNSQADRPKLLY